jgi:hypothetical protein
MNIIIAIISSMILTICLEALIPDGNWLYLIGLVASSITIFRLAQIAYNQK